MAGPRASTSKLVMSSSSTRAGSRDRRNSPIVSCCDGVEQCEDSHLVCCTEEDCEEAQQPVACCSPSADCVPACSSESCNGDGREEAGVGRTGPKKHTLDSNDSSERCSDDPEDNCKECIATEDPLSCDIPGCDLEWDEKAVDELLSCCCASHASQHTSFANPYAAIQKEQEQAQAAITATQPVYTFPALETSQQPWQAAPVSQSPAQTNMSSGHVQVNHDTTSSSNMPRDLANWQSTLEHIRYHHFGHISHAHPHEHHHHEHAHGNDHDQHPSEYRYHCEWSGCSQSFETRESLIGHVNANHLMTLQPKPVFSSASHSNITTPAVAMPDFDSTLKSLWSNCDGALATTGQMEAPPLTINTSNGTDQACPLGALSDLPTASLVKHLLQDHLHLPADLLNQFSPGLSQPALTNSGGIMPLPSPPASFASFTTPPVSDVMMGTANASAMVPHQHLEAREATRTGSVPHTVENSPAVSQKDEHHVCKWVGCTASFSTTGALMEHVSEEHIGSGQSIYYCQWAGCERASDGKGFTQRQKMMRHMRTHVGDKPFVCPECGRAFSESTTLAQHLRTHTNERPYVCNECGKSFAIQSALTIHLRTHSGEKPFRCPHPGCGMSFAESSNLSKHVKTHRLKEDDERCFKNGTSSRKRTRVGSGTIQSPATCKMVKV